MFPLLLFNVYAFPFKYLISNVNPHNDSFNVIFFSIIKSNPARLNTVSFVIFTKIFTSPFAFSLRTFPLSLKMIISLSSIPCGIVTYMVSFSNTFIPFSTTHLSISKGTLAPDNTCSIFILIVFNIGVGLEIAC